MAVLDEAHRQHPRDRDVLMLARDTGDFAPFDAPALDPADTRLRALVSDVEKKAVP